jgi:hypothetical protein
VRAATIFALVAGCVAMALAPVEMQSDQSAREDAARGPTVDAVAAPAQAAPSEALLALPRDRLTDPARRQEPPFVGCGKGQAMARRFRAGQAMRESLPARFEALTDTDVLSYELDIEVSNIDAFGETCTLTGSNRMSIRSLSSNLTEFTFRLDDVYTITGAYLNDTTPVAVTTNGSARVVTLDPPYADGQEYTLTIEYTGATPPGSGFGSFMIDTHSGGTPVVATLSEPWWAHTWWPAKDGAIEQPGDNSDKATLTFSITVPDNFDVPSNGMLQSQQALSGNRIKYTWVSNYAIATYLVSFAASEYNTWTVDYNHARGLMPVEFYIYAQEDNPDNRLAWERVVDMLGTFAVWFGEYPFIAEKYGIYNFPFGGGMEHQTMTGQGVGWFGFSEQLTAHELAHQWFGDEVTCKTWSDIWLNEGPAEYSECLWEENKTDPPDPDALVTCMLDRVPAGAGAGNTVYIQPEDLTDERIFDYNYSYLKGAWVMHMLRGVVGDATFRSIVTNWRAAYAGSAATTADFIDVATDTYGQDLQWFFDQWVYNAGAPAYVYGWEMVTARGADQLQVWILQIQEPPNPSFIMPVDLVATIGAGTETLTVWNNSRFQSYLLPVSGVVTDLQFDPYHWILRSSAMLDDCEAGPSYCEIWEECEPVSDTCVNRYDPCVAWVSDETLAGSFSPQNYSGCPQARNLALSGCTPPCANEPIGTPYDVETRLMALSPLECEPVSDTCVNRYDPCVAWVSDETLAGSFSPQNYSGCPAM